MTRRGRYPTEVRAIRLAEHRDEYQSEWAALSSIAAMCGVIAETRLSGAMTLCVGLMDAHRLVDRASRRDGLTPHRLWLDDGLLRANARLVSQCFLNCRTAIDPHDEENRLAHAPGAYHLGRMRG